MKEGMRKKTIYLRNADLLREIHKSKTSYGSYRTEADAFFHAIVQDEREITPELIAQVIDQAANAFRSIDRKTLQREDLVFRVMTYDDIPLDPERYLYAVGPKRYKTVYCKLPFRPFRHVRVDCDGSLITVGKAFWAGALDHGQFSLNGRMTDDLAIMIQTLIERYCSRNNWRGYSWTEELKANAMLHLLGQGLAFDEGKGSNPFAFYTTCARNSFLRTHKVEKAMLRTHEEFRWTETGDLPSYGTQLDWEFEQYGVYR